MRRVRGDAPLTLAYTMRGDNGNNMLYAFNRGKGEGFIIVPGDDEAVPVLGFGESGHFDADDMPDNMRAWLNHYGRQIAWAQAHGYKKASKAATATKQDIAPLVQAHWSQSGNYARQCIFDGTQCVTGCVATAMAQVMHYWATTGVNNKVYRHGCTALEAYTTQWYGYSVPALPAIETFAWNDMTTGYPSSDNAANAVSTLMRYCGQSIHMEYGPDGSGGNEARAMQAFISCFGYQEGSQFLRRDNMTAEAWANQVYSELAASRPVMMGGEDASTDSGHEFICDGYDAATDTYHINWGWGGALDNWSVLDALTPLEGESYNDYRTLVVGIQPPADAMEDINGGGGGETSS